MLTHELHSPLSEIRQLTLVQAADYADVARRRHEAERRATNEAMKSS